MKLIAQFFVRCAHRLQVLWWFVTRPTTCGVKCLVQFEESFLLVRPAYAHRRYTIPGGGVKRNENPKDAAKRELREEAGIMVDTLKWFGEYSQVVEYKNDTVQCYYGLLDNHLFTIDDFEISEAGWFTRDTLPSDCTASVKKILQLYDNYKNTK